MTPRSGQRPTNVEGGLSGRQHHRNPGPHEIVYGHHEIYRTRVDMHEHRLASPRSKSGTCRHMRRDILMRDGDHRGDILAGRFATSLEHIMQHRAAMGAIQKVCLERCSRARDVLKMELSGAEAIHGKGMRSNVDGDTDKLRSHALFEGQAPPTQGTIERAT